MYIIWICEVLNIKLHGSRIVENIARDKQGILNKLKH